MSSPDFGAAVAGRAVRRARDEGWTKPDGRRATLHVAALAAPTAATAWAAAMWGGAFWALHTVTATVALTSLPAIYHEGAHGNLATNRVANDIAATGAAALGFVPFATWRAFHIEHHAKVGTAGDPETYPARWSRALLLVFPFAQWSFFAILWRWTAQACVGREPAWIHRPAEVVRGGAATSALLAGIAVAMVRWPLLAALLLPGMVLATLTSAVTLVPEHYGPPTGPTSDPLASTVSVSSGPLVRFVLWSSNFHAAHHLLPSVPAHRLRRFDALACRDQDGRWRWASYHSWYAAQLRRLPWRVGRNGEGTGDDLA